MATCHPLQGVADMPYCGSRESSNQAGAPELAPCAAQLHHARASWLMHNPSQPPVILFTHQRKQCSRCSHSFSSIQTLCISAAWQGCKRPTQSPDHPMLTGVRCICTTCPQAPHADGRTPYADGRTPCWQACAAYAPHVRRPACWHLPQPN